MLKITRDFYENSNWEVVYRWSTEVNGKLLSYDINNGPWREQKPPVHVMEQQARRAFEQAIFNGAFRE